MAKLKIPRNYEITTKNKIETFFGIERCCQIRSTKSFPHDTSRLFRLKWQIFNKMQQFQKMVLYLNFMDGESFMSI